MKKDDADEDGADGGDEASELKRDQADATATKQHAPPAARARLLAAADQCDEWEDGGNGRDEKTPPPTPLLRRYMAWPAYLKYETHLAGTAEGSRAGHAQPKMAQPSARSSPSRSNSVIQIVRSTPESHNIPP